MKCVRIPDSVRTTAVAAANHISIMVPQIEPGSPKTNTNSPA